jgi:glutamyl-tRNA synthetase
MFGYFFTAALSRWKRKLSKRKYPEANVEYYQNKGYPNIAVIEYLMNLANSDCEEWRKVNPNKPYSEFELSFKKRSLSKGPLFDEIKLRDISKEVISKMSLDEFYENILNWSKKNDLNFYEKISSNKEYWEKVFSIERDSSKRKDIGTWSEVSKFYNYLDIQEFKLPSWGEFTTPLNSSEVELILEKFSNELGDLKTAEEFMQFMRILAKELGLAENIKEYKASKGELRGHVGLISQVIRFAVTGLNNTPDLFQIIQVLGIEEVKRRLIK